MISKDIRVILKNDGEVCRNTVDYKFDKGIYLNQSDDCFVNYIDYSDKIKNPKDLGDLFASIKSMLCALGYDKVNSVFELMMIDNNFNNIIPLIQDLLIAYHEMCISSNMYPIEVAEYVDMNNYNVIMSVYRDKPNIFYRVFIKSIIKYHYVSKLSRMYISDSRSLYNYFLLNGTVYELFKKLNEPFYSIANGGMPTVALQILSTELEKYSDNIFSHLCWDVCPVGTCVTCPKVMDRHKKDIDEYDFIVSGYQSSLGIGKMVVTDCKRLTLENPNKL